MPESRIRSG